jgi:hypothetical protein
MQYSENTLARHPRSKIWGSHSGVAARFHLFGLADESTTVFQKLGTTFPMTQCHIPENLDLQHPKT